MVKASRSAWTHVTLVFMRARPPRFVILQALLLMALLLMALLCGCASEDAEDEEGLQMCCEIGALCHDIGPSADEEVDACHELGHRNEASACRERYTECLDLCAGVTDNPVEHSCQ